MGHVGIFGVPKYKLNVKRTIELAVSFGQFWGRIANCDQNISEPFFGYLDKIVMTNVNGGLANNSLNGKNKVLPNPIPSNIGDLNVETCSWPRTSTAMNLRMDPKPEK